MKQFRILIGLVLLLGVSVSAVAQEHKSGSGDKVEAAPQNQPAQPQQPAGVTEQLAHTSNVAAGAAAPGHEEEEEGAEFKQSPAVKLVAKLTGTSAKGAYWILVVVNFLIIGGLVAWALKKNLPAMFRNRTETIRKSMDEARRASEDANRRLSDIEGRLSRLDAEIAEMKKTAEADAALEEQRIRASAEEDRVKIVAGAEQEIEAAAKAARRDLKAYAAELAVTLAEKRIKVDPGTDQALVQTFVRQLGKDGR